MCRPLAFLPVAARHLDDVVAELRQHRLRQGVQGQGERGGVERGIHGSASPLAEVAAVRGAGAIGRFAPRDVGKGCAAGNLGAGGIGAAARGGRVARVGQARKGDEAHEGRAGPLEVVVVGAVIGLDFGVGHLDRRVGDDVARHDGGELDLHLFVVVAVLLPQRGVGEIHVGGDDAQQLGTANLVAVLGLERRQVLLRHTRREPPLVLAEIELAVGLELRDLLEFRGRRAAHRLDDFIGRHGDAAPAVFGFQHAALDELVPDLVPNLLVVLEPEGPGRLPLAGVDALLNHRLVRAGVDALTVDLPHRRLGKETGAARDTAQVEHEPGEEREGHDDHQRFGGVPKGLHHRRAVLPTAVVEIEA